MSVSAGEALDLLERAAFDLRQGWPEAALDAAARAVEVLRKEIRERSDAPCRRACSAPCRRACSAMQAGSPVCIS